MSRRTDWHAVGHERSTLADLLEGLAPSEWAVHSLCPGWRVRDVAAHLTTATRRVRPPGLLDEPSARLPAAPPPPPPDERSTEQLVADLRRPVPGAHVRPGAGARDALVEVLVHGQDIARPLGLERPVPPPLAVLAAERVWAAKPFRAAVRYPGVRFEADDADLVLGDGTTVTGPALAVLLALTGRSVALEELSGHGTGLLQRAFSRLG